MPVTAAATPAHDGRHPLDVLYDNRARVPEHPAVLQRWAQASELSRAQLPHHADIPYGLEAGETLDVFPARLPGGPVLVFIHGGWWRALDKREHAFVAPAFVEHGAAVVVPNYALCPSVSIETIALQLTRALAWTWRHAAEHGGDPRRIVVAGHSAGGHLAAMMLSCRWPDVGPDLPADLVKGALSISGVFDLDPLRRAPFLQADLQLTPRSAHRLSPVHHPPPAHPLLAVWGALESEAFEQQARALHAAWGPACVPVCEAVPGTNHFDVLHDFVDPHGLAHRHAQSLLWPAGLGGRVSG